MSNDVLQAALEKITSQQPQTECAVWMVGEQLKDIIRAEPGLAEIVLRDLDVEAMSLTNCEKKIKEWADGHKTGNVAVVTPVRAETIIRAFYGLPERGAPAARPDGGSAGPFVDLAAFF